MNDEVGSAFVLAGGVAVFYLVDLAVTKIYEKNRQIVRGTVIGIDKSDPHNYKIKIDTDGNHETAELVMETGVSDTYKHFQKTGRHDLAEMCIRNNQQILKDLDGRLVEGTLLEMRVHEPYGTIPKTVMSYEIINPNAVGTSANLN